MAVTSVFHLKSISGIQLWCRGIGGGIVLIGPVTDFLFGHTGVWSGDLWMSSSALYHCTAVPTSMFSPQTISGIQLSCREIGGGIVLIGPVRDFLFGHSSIWTGDLWISSPALYHCTMATSSFHLRQYQVFNSGADGLMVVLFWFDLWQIFFLPTAGFWTVDLWISSPALYHCTACQLLVFTSDNFRYLTLVQ